jgi:UDP-N-acetylglucosamine 1-carboxyvinyltransferase
LEELNRMGANIIFCDPHRVIVVGPTPLQGRILKTVDIRGGAALIIAGLIAKGETVIQNTYQIDRGYERIEERLQGIGADIQRTKS